MTKYYFSGKALSALRQVESTEAGFIRETNDGKIAFEDRHFRLTNTKSKTSQATFADDGTEQDAFGEYLLANHATTETAFDDADTGRDMDSRIVNLAWQDGLALDTAVDEFLFAA